MFRNAESAEPVLSENLFKNPDDLNTKLLSRYEKSLQSKEDTFSGYYQFVQAKFVLKLYEKIIFYCPVTHVLPPIFLKDFIKKSGAQVIDVFAEEREKAIHQTKLDSRNAPEYSKLILTIKAADELIKDTIKQKIGELVGRKLFGLFTPESLSVSKKTEKNTFTLKK